MNFTNISNFNQLHESDDLSSTLSLYISDVETVGLVFFVALSGSAGFMLNLVLILSIILTDGFTDTPANIFVLSLACSDLLVCGVSAPLLIYNCYHPIFTIFVTVSKFNVVATTGSIFLLTLNRLIRIVRDLKYPKIMTFKRTVTLVGAIWFAATLVLVLAVVGLIYDIKPIVHITRHFMGFYITSSIVMYAYMYNLARKHRKHLARQAFAVTGQTQAKSDQFRALRSLFMIAGSFAACWLLMTIQAFFTNVARDPIQFYRAFVFTSPLCILNSVVDPVVYYYRSEGFRVSLKKLVRRFKNAGCCEC